MIQQQAGCQQHGRGVCCVTVSDALTGVPGALRIEEHVDFVNRGTCHSIYIWLFKNDCSTDVLLLNSEEGNTFSTTHIYTEGVKGKIF